MAETKPSLTAFAEITISLITNRSHIGMTILSLVVVTINWFLGIFFLAHQFYLHQPIWLSFLTAFALAFGWHLMIVSYLIIPYFFFELGFLFFTGKWTGEFNRLGIIFYGFCNFMSIGLCSWFLGDAVYKMNFEHEKFHLLQLLHLCFYNGLKIFIVGGVCTAIAMIFSARTWARAKKAKSAADTPPPPESTIAKMPEINN